MKCREHLYWDEYLGYILDMPVWGRGYCKHSGRDKPLQARLAVAC